MDFGFSELRNYLFQIKEDVMKNSRSIILAVVVVAIVTGVPLVH